MTLGQYIIYVAVIFGLGLGFGWLRSRSPKHEQQERPELSGFERHEQE